jgi:hypothetical protein
LTAKPISIAALSRSASTSAEATSGRLAFDVQAELPAQEPFSFSGEGAFDKASERASFSIDMSSFAKVLGGFASAFGGNDAKGAPNFDDPSGWKIDVVLDGKVGYVRFPALASQLPAGKSWIRADGNDVKVGGFQFKQFEQYSGSDPSKVLDMLRAVAGSVEIVGVAELRGTETTHYRATIDPSRYQKLRASATTEPGSLSDQLVTRAGVSRIPVDIWIDSGGLVHKLSLSASATQPGTTTSGSASMTFELWDYGKDVAIDLPPADEVVEASALHS